MNKLILVPQQQTLVDNHSHAINVGGTMVRTEISSQPIPVIDPVDILLDMFTPPEIQTWMVKTLSTNLPADWDYSDTIRLSEWAEENCRAPLIVGKSPLSPYSSTQNLIVYVCDGAVRQQQLLSWIAAKRDPKHKFRVATSNYDDMLEIERWLNETVAPRNFSCSTFADNVIVTIRDEKAAVAFRLRWCEEEAALDDAPF